MKRPRLPRLPCAALSLCCLALLVASCGDQPSRPTYVLKAVLEVKGRQGVATDGERYYVSGSTALYVYAKDGTLLLANETPFEDLEQEANHIGDISVHDGELYAGIELFEDGVGSNIQVAVYDAEALTFVRSIPWNPDSGQVEVSAVAVDPAGGSIWMTDWVRGTHVYRYDLETGAYAGKLHLRPVPEGQQGDRGARWASLHHRGRRRRGGGSPGARQPLAGEGRRGSHGRLRLP